MTTADHARLIENLIRLGTVAQVDVTAARVRVQTGELLTTWLPWLTIRAGADAMWNPPTVGEQVLLLSPSGQLTQGVALTGVYSNASPANGNREGLSRTTYRDGAVIEYDSVANALRAELPAGATVQLIATGGITIEGDIALTGTLTASEDVIAAGISLTKHKHLGVTPGSGTSGVPTP